MARERINLEKLLDYVKRYGKYVVGKRLGFLLETYKLGTPEIARELRIYAHRSMAYAMLDPVLPAEGKLSYRWRLRLNVTREELVAGTRT